MYLRTAITMLVMALPLAAIAQEENGNDASRDNPPTLEDMSREVAALKIQVQQLSSVVNEQAESMPSMAEIKSLVDDLKALREVLQAQAAQKELALDSGNLSLSAKMQQDADFRQQMRKAVNESIEQEGEVIVHNKMATEQRIRINQTEHVIPPGDILTVKVPVGTVTAQLPGKALTNWTVTAPSYKQTIDIVPTDSITAAYRPTSDSTTVTTLRPLSATAPVYSAPVYSAPVYSTPVYTPLYVEPYQYEYYDPFFGWVRY